TLLGAGCRQGYRHRAGGAVPGAVKRPAATVPDRRERRPQLEQAVGIVAGEVPDVGHHSAEVEVIERPDDQRNLAEGEPGAAYLHGVEVVAAAVAEGSLQTDTAVEVEAEFEVGAPQVGLRLQMIAPLQLYEAVDTEARRSQRPGVE